MNFFTCTPVSFNGDASFFARDSGLICKGMQQMGIPCKSIMPLPAYPGDTHDDLIRTEYANLESAAWWKSVGATHVVLYSWGAPKYKKVAWAIRNAGAKLFVNMDTSGAISAVTAPKLVMNAQIGMCVRRYGVLAGFAAGLSKFAAHYALGSKFIEQGRINHLCAADAIGCISPTALIHLRVWAKYFAPELAPRFRLVPHPVSGAIAFAGETKKDRVVAVGRWDDVEPKRPQLLARCIERVAAARPSTEFAIYGTAGPILPKWHDQLTPVLKRRIYLHGRVPHEQIVKATLAARVGLCSSSHEGSHIASEEALCAGTSIVAPFRHELSTLAWYVSHDSGQLAVQDTPVGLAEALLYELENWDSGVRNPDEISRFWRNKLGVAAVCQNIIQCLEKE